jgi:hypothetical protein
MTLAFFRRHKKWFMVLMVLAVLSMLLFQAWNDLPILWNWIGGNSGGPAVATIKGGKVAEADVDDFFKRMRVAGSFNMTVARVLESMAKSQDERMRAQQYALGASSLFMQAAPGVAQAFFAQPYSTKAIVAWLAVYREAKAAGFEVSEAQVSDRFKSLAEVGLPPEVFSGILKGLVGGSKEVLVEALRTDMTLAAYIGWTADTLSAAVTPELKAAVVKTDERVKVRVAVLKGATYLPEIKDVPEADLREQFNKYKDVAPGSGPEGHGYRIADKVALEYIAADPKLFESQVKVSDAAVEAYYKQNKDPEFLVKEKVETPPEKGLPEKGAPEKAAPEKATPEKAPAAEKPKSETPAGVKGDAGPEGPTAPAPKAEPAPSPAAPKADPKAEVAPKTETPAVAPKTEAPAPKTDVPAAPAAKAETPAVAAKPPEKKFRPLEEVRDEIRKKLIHEEASGLALKYLHDRVAEIRQKKGRSELGVFADPRFARTGTLPLMTESDLSKVPGIGQADRAVSVQPANARVRSERSSLAVDAFSVKDLAGEKARLAVGEISDPYVGPDGEPYAFRATSVLANHPPDTLSEVRPAVLEDVRKIKAFEKAREVAKAILAKAETLGLQAAAKAYDVTTEDTEGTEGFVPRVTMRFPIQDTVYEIPPQLPGVSGKDASRRLLDECFRMAAEGKKFSDVVLSEQRTAVVVELLDKKAPRLAALERDRTMLARDIGHELGLKTLQQVLDLEAIQKRLDIVVLQSSDEYHPPRGPKNQPSQQDTGGEDF